MTTSAFSMTTRRTVVRPPTEGAGLAAARSEERHAGRRRGALRLRPPTEGTGLAAADK